MRSTRRPGTKRERSCDHASRIGAPRVRGVGPGHASRPTAMWWSSTSITQGPGAAAHFRSFIGCRTRVVTEQFVRSTAGLAVRENLAQSGHRRFSRTTSPGYQASDSLQVPEGTDVRRALSS